MKLISMLKFPSPALRAPARNESRSSRGNEALTFFAERRVSLLTSAATKLRVRAALFVYFVYFVVPLWAASSPFLIPFQGRLTNPQGVPYTNGQYTITFNLYDQAVGGSNLWSETHYKVGVINGMVNVFLGSIQSLTNVSFAETRHLGITIDADGNPNTPDPEMVPRQMIIPSFWAKQAENSAKLAGYDWSPLMKDGVNNPQAGFLRGDKIQNFSITAGQIASNTITADQIAPSTITASQIASGTIVAANLDPSLTMDSIIPPGTIQAFGGTNVPVGWLLCDGRPVSRNQYPRLYTAVSTNWGAGIPASTNNFNLPDLRGMFLRGSGGHGTQAKASGGSFAGGTIGEFQQDQMQGHRHTYQKGTAVGNVVAVSVLGAGYSVGYETYSSGGVGAPTDEGTNGPPRTGQETKPASYSVNYIIKY